MSRSSDFESGVSYLSLIVGLGNPGKEYRDTRHNAGFMLVERLARHWGAAWRMEPKFFAELAETSFSGRRLVLCKPQTYMNESGKAVGRVAAFFRVTSDRTLVLVDDADLPLGTIRLRPEGSSGGHHGLASVESHLGTRHYPRLKLGIARPAQAVRDITAHVLARFSAEDGTVWEKVLVHGIRQVETWVGEGTAKAMSSYNGPVQ